MRHASPAAAPRRNDRIDTLRAIACISLVAFHVVGSSPGSGLELPGTHWLSQANRALVDLRMPLFSFLSGMVLPALSGPPGPQIGKKMRRLLLPMATVGTIFWLTRHLMGYSQIPLAQIYWMPYAHFWFLQATFLIMAAFFLGSAASGGRSSLTAALIGLVGAALYISPDRPSENVFSIIHAWKLAPFLAAGFLISAHRPQWLIFRHRGAALAGLAAAATLAVLLAGGVIKPDIVARRALSVALGLSFCLCLLAFRPENSALARIGRHSYPIYLFHVFFTAATLKLVAAWMPDAPVLVPFALAVIAGLAGPALLGQALARHPSSALLFLGVRQRRTGPRPIAAEA